MGRLEQLRVVDPVLTTLARGYTNAQLVADALFPFVPMEKEGGKIPVFGKEAFKIYPTERAIRADSNRINPDGRSTVDVVLTEHDLEYPIDYREAGEDVFPTEEHGTRVVTEGIRLRHEKLSADLAQSATNFPSGSKTELSGTAQFTHADSDPVAVVETAKEAIRGKIGRRPNTMVIGAASYRVLKSHPKLLERIKYSQLGVVTVELMKIIFGVENISVGEAIYVNAGGTFIDIWGDNVVLAWSTITPAQNRTFYEPSFGYTLQKKGMPEVDKYVAQGGKLSMVRNTDIFLPKIVGAEAGYLIENTNA
jgi:hypothetical protein